MKFFTIFFIFCQIQLSFFGIGQLLCQWKSPKIWKNIWEIEKKYISAIWDQPWLPSSFVEDLEPCVAKKMMICGSLEHCIQVPDEKFMVSNCSTGNLSAVGVSLMMVWRFLGDHTAYTPVAKVQKKWHQKNQNHHKRAPHIICNTTYCSKKNVHQWTLYAERELR